MSILEKLFGTKNDLEKIMSHGFDDYLYKPVRQTELLRKIARHLPYTATEKIAGKPSLELGLLEILIGAPPPSPTI